MQKTVKDLMTTLGEVATRLKAAAEPDVYISQTDFSTLQNDVEGDEKALIAAFYQLLLDRESPNGRLTKSDIDGALIELQKEFLMSFELAPGELTATEEERFSALGDSHLVLARALKVAAVSQPVPNYPNLAIELGLLANKLSFGEVYAPNGHEPFEGVYIPAGIAGINRGNFLPAISQVDRFRDWDTLYRNVRTEPSSRFFDEFVALQSEPLRPQAVQFIERFMSELDRHEIVTVEENEEGSGYPVFWLGFTPEDDWVGIWTITYR